MSIPEWKMELGNRWLVQRKIDKIPARQILPLMTGICDVWENHLWSSRLRYHHLYGHPDYSASRLFPEPTLRSACIFPWQTVHIRSWNFQHPGINTEISDLLIVLSYSVGCMCHKFGYLLSYWHWTCSHLKEATSRATTIIHFLKNVISFAEYLGAQSLRHRVGAYLTSYQTSYPVS